MRPTPLVALFFALSAAAGAWAGDAPSPTVGGLPYDAVANVVGGIIAEAIPHEYEKYQDWGKTKRITTGVNLKGHVWDPKIQRRKSEVSDGIWKHYRVTLVEPEKNLVVRIDNLRGLDAGRIAFTLYVTAKVHGWAQARVFEDGIPLGTYTAEGDSQVVLWIDSEIGLETTPSSFLTGIAIHPHVTAARIKLEDFRLTRFGEIKGSLAHELGDGMKHLIEDQLDGPKLADKLNHSIDKRRGKLKFTPEKVLGLTWKR